MSGVLTAVVVVLSLQFTIYQGWQMRAVFTDSVASAVPEIGLLALLPPCMAWYTVRRWGEQRHLDVLGVLVMVVVASGFFLAAHAYLASGHVHGLSPWAGALVLTAVSWCGPAALGMRAQQHRADAAGRAAVSTGDQTGEQEVLGGSGR